MINEQQAKRQAQEQANATGRRFYVVAWWDEEAQYYSYTASAEDPRKDPDVVANEEFNVVGTFEPQHA
jgi:hypothetical protein